MENNRIFSHYQTRTLADKNAPAEMEISSDLGLSSEKILRSAQGWQFTDGQILDFAQIQRINKNTNHCYKWIDGGLQKVEAFSTYTNLYYSLMPTAKAPTMLISGIPMHRIKGTTPLEDTKTKIKALGMPHGYILDTATGLGYTAMQAARTCEKLITIEFDPAVIKICRANPWSQGLFTNPKISQLIGDSYDLAHTFPEQTFTAIIHDPPTFSLAGHLYSRTLYQAFFRILKPSGRLFHYIGNPDSRSGASVGKGVVERLQKCGFSVSPKPFAFGVLAVK